MPRVPYEPYPSTQPISPGERLSVQTPGAAFGENIGAALTHLGATGEQVGGELFARAEALQQLKNEAEARELQTQHAQQTAPIVADFDAREGIDARNNLIPHLNNLQKVRDSLADSASNPAVKRLFLNDTAGFMQRETFSAARHAGDQFKNYVIGTAQARSDLVQHTWTDPSDQREVDAKIHEHDADGETIAAARGWSKDQLDDWKLKQTSQTYAGQLNALALRGKTEEAFARLDQYQKDGKLTQEHYEAVQKILWRRNEAIGAEFLAKKIETEMPDASPKQKMDRLGELAPDLAHGDPDFLNAAEHHLRTVEHLDNTAQFQNQRFNEQKIYKLITSGQVNTYQELLSNAEGKAAYDALAEGRIKNDMPKMIANAVLARDTETHMQNYKELEGMAHDPTRRHEFLQTDFFDPKWHLGLRDIDHFLSLRERAIKTPLDDPLVRSGWAGLRQRFSQQLEALGVIDKNTGKEKFKQADLLRGGMTIALEEFMAANKRPPSDRNEFDEKIAKPLLKEHAEAAWPFGMRSRQVPEFATTFDKKTIEDARKELTVQAQKEGTDPPNDNEIRAYIIHQQWKEHFQGSGGRQDENWTGKRGGSNIPD